MKHSAITIALLVASPGFGCGNDDHTPDSGVDASSDFLHDLKVEVGPTASWTSAGPSRSVTVEARFDRLRLTDVVTAQLIADSGKLDGKSPGEATLVELRPFEFNDASLRRGKKTLVQSFCAPVSLLALVGGESAPGRAGSVDKPIVTVEVTPPATPPAEGPSPYAVIVTANPNGLIVGGESRALLGTSRGALGTLPSTTSSTASVPLVRFDATSSLRGHTTLYLESTSAAFITVQVNGVSTELEVPIAASGTQSAASKPCD